MSGSESRGRQCVSIVSGVARSQTTPGHCTRLFSFFWFGGGGRLGACSPSKFCILEVATQIVLETMFVGLESAVDPRLRHTCAQYRSSKVLNSKRANSEVKRA